MEDKKPDKIDYFIYEQEMFRAERHSKRWALAFLIVFLALIGTNVGWIVYEAQWRDEIITQEVTQDGGGENTNIFAHGDYNGAEGENNNTKAN